MSDAQAPARSLAEIGRDAARTAQRAALLGALEACGWRMSVAAKVVGVAGTSGVLHQIERLGLQAEYADAKARGLFQRGRHHLPTLTVDARRATVAA